MDRFRSKVASCWHKKCFYVYQMLFQAIATLRRDARLSMFLRVPIRMYLAHKITHNAGIMMVGRCTSARPLEFALENLYLYYREGSNGQSNVSHEKTLGSLLNIHEIIFQSIFFCYPLHTAHSVFSIKRDKYQKESKPHFFENIYMLRFCYFKTDNFVEEGWPTSSLLKINITSREERIAIRQSEIKLFQSRLIPPRWYCRDSTIVPC